MGLAAALGALCLGPSFEGAYKSTLCDAAQNFPDGVLLIHARLLGNERGALHSFFQYTHKKRCSLFISGFYGLTGFDNGDDRSGHYSEGQFVKLFPARTPLFRGKRITHPKRKSRMFWH